MSTSERIVRMQKVSEGWLILTPTRLLLSKVDRIDVSPKWAISLARIYSVNSSKSLGLTDRLEILYQDGGHTARKQVHMAQLLRLASPLAIARLEQNGLASIGADVLQAREIFLSRPAPAPVRRTTQRPPTARTDGWVPKGGYWDAKSKSLVGASSPARVGSEEAPMPSPTDPPDAAASLSSSSGLDVVGALERLKRLLDDGTITPEEFAAAKKRVLD